MCRCRFLFLMLTQFQFCRLAVNGDQDRVFVNFLAADLDATVLEFDFCRFTDHQCFVID